MKTVLSILFLLATVSLGYTCVPGQVCEPTILTGGIASVSDPCTGTMYFASRDIFNRIWIGKANYQKHQVAKDAFWCLLSSGYTAQTPSISLGDGIDNIYVPQTACNSCEPCKPKKYLRVTVKGMNEGRVFVGSIDIENILCETKTKDDDPCPIEWDLLWE